MEKKNDIVAKKLERVINKLEKLKERTDKRLAKKPVRKNPR